MPNDMSDMPQVFSVEQTDIAGTNFEKDLADLERKTIGVNFNQRQRDLLVILAAKYEADAKGHEVTRPTLEAFRFNIAEHLGVNPQTIKNDLDTIGDLVHTPFIGDSRRDKTYWLTEKGIERYRAYKQGKAGLIVVTAEAIRNLGHRAKTTVSSLALAGTFFAGLMFSTAAESSELATAIAAFDETTIVVSTHRPSLNGQIMLLDMNSLISHDHEVLVTNASRVLLGGSSETIGSIVTDASPTLRADAVTFGMATVQHHPNIDLTLGGGVTWEQEDAALGNWMQNDSEPTWQVADRSSMFEEHLPKVSLLELQMAVSYN